MTMRIVRFFCLLGLACGLTLLLTPSLARADGGAPNLAYVAGGDGGVSVIDIAQQKVVNSIKVEGDPEMVLLSLDGRFLYVTQPKQGKVSLVSAKTGNNVCSAALPGHPGLLAVDPNTNLLFAGANDASTVTSIDVKGDTCTVKQTFQVGGPVYGLAVVTLGTSSSVDSGNQLWVATTDAILIFDDLTGKQVAKIAVPEGPRYLSAPVGTAAYATTAQGTVIAIDFNTHQTLTLISGGEYGPMDYDAITTKIYVPDKRNQQLVVLNPVDANFVKPKSNPKPLDLGVVPVSIAITSDGAFGFVALEGGDTAMYDIPGRSLLNTIKVGGTPRFIITGIYPPSIGDTPEQANTIQTVMTVVAYVVVALLLIVPIVLFRRYSKARAAEDKKAAEDSGEEDGGGDEIEADEEDLAELEAGPQSPSAVQGSELRKRGEL
jgi:DNA-binding beta-propeller fold protein YncE